MIRIPADWEPHSCCWMAWAVHREWGRARTKVMFELSEVIHTIARFEQVHVLARRGCAFREAVREFSTCSNITVIEAPVDDIWMRDVAPTFALRNGRAREDVVAIDWNFNSWGGTHERPPRAGDGLAKTAAEVFGVPRVSLGIVAEGGAFVTNGKGTTITTRSCLLNPNRNSVHRGTDCQLMIEKDLGKLGIRKVIWLEGDPCEPITSGHADGYVLCAPGSVVLVDAIKDKDIEPPQWRTHDIALLENTPDADGRRIKVVRVLAPRTRYWKGDPEMFAACYLNVYVANDAVIGAQFGDAERDDAARRALAKSFPGREIVMLRIDHIANGGGGVRCLTQSMPSRPIQERTKKKDHGNRRSSADERAVSS